MASFRSQSTAVAAEAPIGYHNRWHPDIPPVLRIAPGMPVSFATRDGDDGQIDRDTTVADLAGLDALRAHAMTGPFFVEGAEPGDQLRVHIDELIPADFGWTTILPGRFGLLRDRFDSPLVVRWELRDGVATSDDLPGVRVRGAPFLGLVGTAPSRALLAQFAAREAALAEAGAVVMQPNPRSALPAIGPAASDGLRTVPPRETGGNFDIKELRAGSTLVLPVAVPGALLSAGDMHFAQGDGEASGTAIECAGRVTMTVELVKRHAIEWRGRFPHLEFCDGGEPYIGTVGLSLTDEGTCLDMDITAAARAAILDLVDYLGTVRGLSSSQAHVLVSAAVDLRLSSVVNFPTAVVLACLPLQVFED